MSTIVTPITPQMVTIAEAARILGSKPWPVAQLCEAGTIPSTMIGERRMIPLTSIRQYVERVMVGGVA